MNDEYNKCIVWEKTEIIDLPFLPFEDGKIVTTKMINESAKYIKYIKNGKFRLTSERNSLSNNRFFFYKTDTLIAVDISTLESSFCSYLDELYFVLKMYPMVFINSYIDKIKNINLHSYCLKNHYILPVFGSVPFLDKAASKKYSIKLEELIKGNVKSLKVNELLESGSSIPLKQIKNRFPQFDFSDNNILFTPKITWLGVEDPNMEKLLNYLFNNNISQVNYKEMVEEFNLDESLLKEYIKESMLFFSEGESIFFRLLRKNIYWGFVCNLADQFEQEMIDRDAICYELSIDQSIGTVRNIIESVYHKIGKLFTKKDSFSYKLFAYLKRYLETIPNSNILIVDNGNMEEIVSMLYDMDLKNRVYKVLDYFGEAVAYPNVCYEKLKNESVVIVIDVINTGKLIHSVIDFLKIQGCNDISIFSYIVNESYSFDKIIDKNVSNIFYLTEKELSNIENILTREYENRFKKDIDLNFKMLWGDINNNIQLKERENVEIVNNIATGENIKEKFVYDFLLQNNIHAHSYIYQKLKKILCDYDIVLLQSEYENFETLIKNINQKDLQGLLKISEIKKDEINRLIVNEDYFEKSVLLIMPINYIKSNMQNIIRYMKGNNIKKWRYLDIVDCELYSLESRNVINELDNESATIFNSKLKRYAARLDNPQLS